MRVPVLAGPTGVGKTAVATALARLTPLGVVSADSRQVYRGLAIGTAAPTEADRAAAPHRGVGFVDPRERYSAGRFARDAAGWLADIAAGGRTPLVVGGTGFYLRALFEGLFAEPELGGERRARLGVWLRALPAGEAARWARRLDRGFPGGGRQREERAVEVALLAGRPLSALQRERPAAPAPATAWYAVLSVPRAVLHERLARRTRAMLDAGWIDEVRRALADGVPPDAPGLSAVGYREIVAHLQGRLAAADLERAIGTATRRYARRQETWFRHQLAGPVARVDAQAGADALARLVLDRYRAAET